MICVDDSVINYYNTGVYEKHYIILFQIKKKYFLYNN